MSNQLEVISNTLRAPETTGKLMLALGYDDPQNAQAKNDAKRYAASVLAELGKMALDEKKRDILNCNPQSIVQTMVDAAKFRLMIDGRQHAHIVKYGNNATLQIGYRGYIAKIAEHYENTDLNVFPVWKGDVLEISGTDGFDRYTHHRAKAFNDDINDLDGVCGVLYYTKGGREFQKIVTMSKAEIGKIKNAAKVKTIWDAWYVEKAKVAAVKRICKLQFSSISIIQEMVAYDNQKHYDIEKPIDDTKPGSIVDNLNKGLATKQAENKSDNSDDVIDGTFTRDESDTAPQDAVIDTADNPDLQRIVKRICMAISAEQTEQGILDIFEMDFPLEIAEIKAASQSEYSKIVKMRDDRVNELRNGGLL